MKSSKLTILTLLFLVTIFLFNCKSDDENTLGSGLTDDTIKISDDIDEDLRLTNIVSDPNQADYLVTNLIDINKVLTIDPGVVIAFEANAGFNIEGIIDTGVLIAKGTASDPITFTGKNKTKGFWRGIRFFTNDVRNELDHVIVEYAGSDNILDDIKGSVKAAIGLNYEPGNFISSVKLTNSTIRENDGYGLAVEQECNLRTFKNNQFSNNSEASVLLTPPSVYSLDIDSKYSGSNGYDGIEIHSNSSSATKLRNDAIWLSFKDGSSYYVSSSIEIESMLTIMPGAIFEFEANTALTFKQDFTGPDDGILIAKGTTENPIIFTSINKTQGYWKGIIIQSDSNLNHIDNCIIEYGGSDPIDNNNYGGNINIDLIRGYNIPKLKIANSKILQSGGCGIVIDTSIEELPDLFLNENNNNYKDNVDGEICN